MKLTPKLGVYGTLIVGGAIWLAFDQLATPADVDAATVAFAADKPASLPSASSSQGLQLRLKHAFASAVADETIDPFADIALRSSTASPAASTVQVDWKLSAVMRSARGGCAIVDGQAVEVGESYQGYRLLAVDHERAVFRQAPDKAAIILRLGK